MIDDVVVRKTHRTFNPDAFHRSAPLIMLFNDVELTTETYDDELALRAYVFKHFRHLMTPLERRTLEYSVPIIGGTQHDTMQRLHAFLEGRDGHVADDDVIAAFAFTSAERKNAAIDRLIASQIELIIQNRCPRCNRLARTPMAKQCLWCHHDWH